MELRKADQTTEMKETRKGYRFSGRTIENLEFLIKTGVVRNETEAIDLALEHLATEYRTGDIISAIKKGEISLITPELEIYIKDGLKRGDIKLTRHTEFD